MKALVLKPLGVAVLLCAGMLCASFPARAQSSWLEQGQQLLNKFGAPSTAGSGSAAGLSSSEIGRGLKEALRVATDRVVSQLGHRDGFNADPAVHIPLPSTLAKVKSTLGRLGMSGQLDDLELRLNRAAELATPKAKELFVQAISEMTIDDAKRIYNGPPDAATRYFQGKMSQPLAREMTPLVNESLADAGAVKAYDDVMGRYRALPFVPDVKSDLSSYVVQKAMDGIFHYLGQEEAAIRQDPAKRTTALLRQVFGASH